MFSLFSLLRDAAAGELAAYLATRGVPVPLNFDWKAPLRQRASGLHDLVDAQSQDIAAQIHDDAQRVLAMANDAGITALASVGGMLPELLELENDVTRMLWLLMHEPAMLDQAEQVRYADSKRLGRTWAGFVGPVGVSLRRDVAATQAMLEAVRSLLDTPQAELEICERSRPGAPSKLMQVIIFHEGRLNSRRAFVQGALSRVPDRPVEESVITYEPATGTIETIARTREHRLGLAKLLAEYLLDAQIDGQSIRLREYQLDHLRRPFRFETEEGHKIAAVRMTRATLLPLDTQSESIVFECEGESSRSIWAMSAERFGDRDPFVSGYRLREVVLRVIFERQPRRRRRTISVRITLPQGCNLKDKSEPERLIGQHYLEKWRLVAEV